MHAGRSWKPAAAPLGMKLLELLAYFGGDHNGCECTMEFALTANGCQATRCELPVGRAEPKGIRHTLGTQFGNFDLDLQLILEVRRTLVVAGGGNTRPSDYGRCIRAWRKNAKSQVTECRVLGLLHPDKEHGEMSDSSGIRVAELDALRMAVTHQRIPIARTAEIKTGASQRGGYCDQ